jgi:hypothetical protein
MLDVEDKLEVEPPELAPLFADVMTISLAKRIAPTFTRPWTEENEADLQERLALLVGAARERGLTTFNVIVVKPDGRRIVREMSVEKFSQGQVLQ